jgi:hypothetical protein
MINFYKLPFEEYIREAGNYDLDYVTLHKKLKKGLAPLNFDSDTKKMSNRIRRNLLKLYKKQGFEVLERKSSNRRGSHFTVFKDGRQLFLPIKKVLRIREKVGDCYGRISCDKLRSKYSKLPISILFNHKAKPFRKYHYPTSWKEVK